MQNLLSKIAMTFAIISTMSTMVAELVVVNKADRDLYINWEPRSPTSGDSGFGKLQEESSRTFGTINKPVNGTISLVGLKGSRGRLRIRKTHISIGLASSEEKPRIVVEAHNVGAKNYTLKLVQDEQKEDQSAQR